MEMGKENLIQGLKAFLASSFTKGVGRVYAGKIVDRFGTDLLEPGFDFKKNLPEITGLSQKTIDEFAESIKILKVSPKIFTLLFSAGLKETEIEKIISHYGSRTERIIEWDPYDMVENVWKFNFFSADKIGRFLGIAPNDPRRIKGAVLTAVKFYAEQGSMFATEEETIRTVANITGVNPTEIPPLINELIQENRLVRSLGVLYLPVYYKAEKEAADKIFEILAAQSKKPQDFKVPEKDIDGHDLNESQKKAIETVVRNKVTIITGGPGTGKTTAVNGIIKLFLDSGKKTVLTAPTGRAAKRMSDLTGEEAKTIHRLLGYSMGKGYKNKKFDADVLIIDEASMLEQVLFNHLLQAIKPETTLVLVGDTDQLPAIGAGNVLKDMIDSGKIPVIKLTENFRQKEGSLISYNAEKIKEGKNPDSTPANDFVLVEETDSKKIHDRLISLVSREIPSYTGIEPKDIQVVTPQQEGELGAKQLNLELQDFINPGSPEIRKGMKKFRLGDRVMQILNNKERGIYNGETGYISNLDTEAKVLTVTFSDGKTSSYGPADFKELTLAYATTVHKLQGSETDYMVMLLSTEHRPMLYRNLLYTGVSRAKKLCVILGDQKAMDIAVSTIDKNNRNSNFKHRIKA